MQHFIPFSRVSRKRKKTLSLTKYSPYFRIFQNDIMITKESSSLVDSKKDGAAQPPILQLEEPSKGTFFSKVKLSLVILTTFEFSRQKRDAKLFENDTFQSIQSLE